RKRIVVSECFSPKNKIIVQPRKTEIKRGRQTQAPRNFLVRKDSALNPKLPNRIGCLRVSDQSLNRYASVPEFPGGVISRKLQSHSPMLASVEIPRRHPLFRQPHKRLLVDLRF